MTSFHFIWVRFIVKGHETEDSPVYDFGGGKLFFFQFSFPGAFWIKLELESEPKDGSRLLPTRMAAARFMDCSEKLAELYEDLDRSRKQEVDAISGPNEFAEFYSRYKALREFYKKHPDEIAVPMSIEFEKLTQHLDDPDRVEDSQVDFTDEEGYGRFLDLHECYLRFCNIKGLDRIDYVSYLKVFHDFTTVPRERKGQAEYRRYLESLLHYLTDFLARTRPLLDLSEELGKAMEGFDAKWESGDWPGWSNEQQPAGALTHTGQYLDLSPFNSADELIPLGLDRLKSALVSLGLKCGGTAEERAHRLFLTKGRRVDQLDKSLFAKKATGQTQPSGPTSSEKAKHLKNREFAVLECQIGTLTHLLEEEREATKDNVERKQARGGVDDETENAEAGGAAEGSDESDAEDDTPYNPKNLPLGWDGKPIPYWLYKLHGLNISYACEICGNATYRGPKAFQRHFSEWRHANGMRCLNIPNTAHFANITKIADAVALWQKLSYEKERERFKPEIEEEFEDGVGNVVSRIVYDDMKRQGLL